MTNLSTAPPAPADRAASDVRPAAARQRPSLGSVFFGSVIAWGLVALAVSAWSLFGTPLDARLLMLALLTVVGGQLMLRMPGVPISFSISDVFTFTTALMFGPGAAAVVVALDAGVISTRLAPRMRTLTRVLFNITAAALSMWLAATVFYEMSGELPLVVDPTQRVPPLGALAVFAAVYFFFNTGLVALAIALSERHAVWTVWREHFMNLWPGYFGGASGAGLAVFLVSGAGGDLKVLALVAPVPFILYVTFRTAVARMHDQMSHLTRVNSMYLATIETLAQAVDARDEVTHDHIRRVQSNAMRLAGELGIADEVQLRALEAAALLHDIGKLAVPEHILNKPDKLSVAEFETMKLHTTIGADILSRIGFPFPVVPIVRHHHENWDGSGYPDALRGEAIPIGARIIAVVDCFDALISDRPYRRAMSPEAALAMIEARSGTMYDPAVVAGLMRVKEALALAPATAHESALPVVSHSQQALKTAQTDVTITAATVAIAGQLGHAIGRHQHLEVMCDELHAQFQAMMPELTAVVYRFDPHMDQLYGRAAWGVHRGIAEGLVIGMGLRLTGWVAANRTSIVNSEAALDLGNLVASLTPPPQLCLSTPMIVDRSVAGVLTVYSCSPRPFGARDVALFELLAALLAPVVAADPAVEHAPALRPVRARQASLGA